METTTLPTDTPQNERHAIEQAVDCLRRCEPVALPTETVYGLAADATEVDAIAAIFAAKNRPSTDPLIIHLPNLGWLERVATVPPEIAPTVAKLVKDFWPGAMTLVLPKTELIPSSATAGGESVAVRLSGFPLFHKIIKAFGKPLAAPSANLFGGISPTAARAVAAELGGRIPLIIDGGACPYGLESTIIRVVAPPPEHKKAKVQLQILRPGAITPNDLQGYGKILLPSDLAKIREKKNRREETEAENEKTPGSFSRHYSPQTPLRLLRTPDEFVPETGKKYALLSFRGLDKDGYTKLADFELIGRLSPKVGKMPEAAMRLYHLLRELDALGVDEIIAEPVPERGLGIAIMDRLRRAAAQAV